MKLVALFLGILAAAAAAFWLYEWPRPTTPVKARPVVYVPADTSRSPVPKAAGVKTATAEPSRVEVPSPDASPSPTASPPPAVPVSTAPPVAIQKPGSFPKIISVSLSTGVASAGQVVLGTVETSSNVASVEARIGGYSAAMHKEGVGRFALSYRVPNLPAFLRQGYLVQIIARNAKGVAVSTAVPITIK